MLQRCEPHASSEYETYCPWFYFGVFLLTTYNSYRWGIVQVCMLTCDFQHQPVICHPLCQSWGYSTPLSPSQFIKQSSSVYHWPSIHFSGTDTRGFSNLVRIHRTHGFQTHTYFSNKDLFLFMDEEGNSTTWPNMIRPFTVELAVIIDNT